MPTTDDDFEHWPADNKNWTQPTVAAAGYDSNNGLRSHTYLPPAPTKCTTSAVMPSSPPPSQVIYSPMYFAHPLHQAMSYPQQPQYYSHLPHQAIFTGYTMPQPQLQPQLPVIAEPAPAPAPRALEGTKFHMYQPAYSEQKNISKEAPAPVSGPPSNVWLGRTKAQVEEDNMRTAKREGVYDKCKIAPVGVKDSQIFWVVELDGSHSLSEFRYIKELNGTWKKDPRFEDSYYFVREEEEGKM